MKITEPDTFSRSDIVVIGSGPGGAVTAATLAGAGREVLLLEEGMDAPQDSCGPLTFREMQQKYRAGGITAALGWPNIAYAEGCCVGGGSEIGFGLYERPPASVLENWAKNYKVDFFSATTLEQHFMACERIMQPVSYAGTLPLASSILRDGARKRGMASMDIPRMVNFMSELDQHGVPFSRRRSMSETFLPLFLQNEGKLQACTRVQKLARHRDGWEVHAIYKDSRPLIIRAAKVFVCAGAVHSAALLQRSGIRRNIGRTLSLQPMVRLTAEFPEPVNNSDAGIAGEQVTEFYPEFFFNCADSSKARLAISLADQASGIELVRSRHQHLLSYNVISRGLLQGSVHAIPGFRDPIVRYSLAQQELLNLGKGIKALTRLLLAAGALRVFTGLPDKPVIDSLSQTDSMASTLPDGFRNVTAIHLSSSCPMGEDPRAAAVNSWGRVHGHPGLYVSDVSTLCTSPGVNPQGTIMALARRNSEHFLQN